MKAAHTVLVKKPKEKRPLGRSMHRWEDNIEINLKEIRLQGVDWIHLVQW
jgi:hypothetical protein